jgi:tetratricopeptide (TPR) repeat protein
MARTEIFRMLQQYDTAVIICNRLLKLDIDSAVILSQRGLCYYQEGQIEKACADFTLTKKLATKDVSFLDKFMKNCK